MFARQLASHSSTVLRAATGAMMAEKATIFMLNAVINTV
jgi:hypothetical protein